MYQYLDLATRNKAIIWLIFFAKEIVCQLITHQADHDSSLQRVLDLNLHLKFLQDCCLYNFLHFLNLETQFMDSFSSKSSVWSFAFWHHITFALSNNATNFKASFFLKSRVGTRTSRLGFKAYYVKKLVFLGTGGWNIFVSSYKSKTLSASGDRFLKRW